MFCRPHLWLVVAPSLLAAPATASDLAIERTRQAVRLMRSLDRGFTDLSHIDRQESVRQGDEPAKGLTWVTAGPVTASVETRTGRITTFKVMLYQEDLDKRRADPSPRLTLEQAQAVCRDLYRISDDRWPLAFTSYSESESAFELWAKPHVGPIPLWDARESVFEIDRHRGLVRWAEMGYAPDLSRANAATVAPEVARRSALAAYARHRPYVRGTVRGPLLALAVPEFEGTSEASAEHIALAEAGQAIPVLVTFVGDQEAFVDRLQSWARFQYVFVDARDGSVIAIRREVAPSMNYDRLDGTAAKGLAGWTLARLPGDASDLAVSLKARSPARFLFAGSRVQFVSGDETVSGDYDRFLRVLRVRLASGEEWYDVSGSFAERLAMPLVRGRRFGSRV